MGREQGRLSAAEHLGPRRPTRARAARSVARPPAAEGGSCERPSQEGSPSPLAAVVPRVDKYRILTLWARDQHSVGTYDVTYI